MVDAQGGRCAICQRQTRLVLDHDHETGSLREMLCTKCNKDLAPLESHPWLEDALAYLKHHSKD